MNKNKILENKCLLKGIKINFMITETKKPRIKKITFYVSLSFWQKNRFSKINLCILETLKPCEFLKLWLPFRQ